jgi:GT2 family glycosyltransferase
MNSLTKMAEEDERVTVSIVSHGHVALLSHLLQDLASIPTKSILKIVVTLNLANEAFDPKRYPMLDITTIRNKTPKGFGENHNTAFLQCETRWFAILNPDIRLNSDPFPSLLAEGRARPSLGLIGPKVLSPAGTLEDSVRANLTPLSLIARRVLGRRRPERVNSISQRGGQFYWLAGMFMLARADAFRALGGFDGRFFMYCEDYDLCARMYAGGYGTAYVERASVTHDARRANLRLNRHMLWHLTSLLRVWTSAAFYSVLFQTALNRHSARRKV